MKPKQLVSVSKVNVPLPPSKDIVYKDFRDNIRLSRSKIFIGYC